MGSLYARKRGDFWQYRFEAAKIDGKRKEICKSGFKTKKEALEAGTKALSEYNNSGLHFEPTEMSFHDYMDYWLKNYCEVNVKKTTYDNYFKKIRLYIKPELGKYKISSLTPAVLQEFINRLFNQGFSRNTIAVIKGILSGSLGYAVEPLQFIRSNPMSLVRTPSVRATPKIQTRQKEKHAVPLEQWKTIINRFPEGHPAHIPLQLAYRCGLRLGEVFAVCWEDVDFTSSCLNINKQVQMLDNYWTITKPKYNSDRTINIDSKLLNLLRNEMMNQERNKQEYDDLYTWLLVNDKHQINIEKGNRINLINIRENGTYIQPRTMQHVGRVIHYELNIPRWDFHSLRHTHTTMLLEAGTNPVNVQKRLGHKNIDVTLGIYTHITEKMKEVESSILEAIFN